MSRYPHNQLGFPTRPKVRWEQRVREGYAPLDRSWAFHQTWHWLEGQDPRTVEFIDIAYQVGVRR